MELQGKIKLIKDTQTFGGNGFRKREMVIITDDQYPQMILIEFVQDKCDLLNNFNIDDNVKIGINIRGREWINPKGEAVYFNSIQGWRIEKSQNDTSATATELQPVDNSENEPDDLPF